MRTDFDGVDMMNERQCLKLTTEFGQYRSKNIQFVALNVILERSPPTSLHPLDDSNY